MKRVIFMLLVILTTDAVYADNDLVMHSDFKFQSVENNPDDTLKQDDKKKSQVPTDDVWQAININKDHTSIAMYKLGYSDGYYDEDSLLLGGFAVVMEDPDAARAYFRGKRIGKNDRQNGIPSYF